MKQFPIYAFSIWGSSEKPVRMELSMVADEIRYNTGPGAAPNILSRISLTEVKRSVKQKQINRIEKKLQQQRKNITFQLIIYLCWLCWQRGPSSVLLYVFVSSIACQSQFWFKKSGCVERIESRVVQLKCQRAERARTHAQIFRIRLDRLRVKIFIHSQRRKKVFFIFKMFYGGFEYWKIALYIFKR